jgi:probable HAF family extracellular repeat protein
MVGLGGLPGGSPGSEAMAVSDDGSVVVGFGHSNASGTTSGEAFRWTAAGGMVGLGDLPGGNFNSIAFGVSDDGSVVVGAGATAAAPSEAFYWTADDGMRRLSDVLIEHGVNPAALGWTRLSGITGVSGDGNVVSGVGIRNGGFTEAFVAVIPEPASLGLLAVALGALAVRRARR